MGIDDGQAGAAFGTKMKERRVALGFTLRDVEAITENSISNGYLSQLENGKIKNPSAHVVVMLCSAYAVSFEEAWAWLGIKVKIEPPKICGECGQVVPKPKQYIIDAAPSGQRCLTHCGDACDCEARSDLSNIVGTADLLARRMGGRFTPTKES